MVLLFLRLVIIGALIYALYQGYFLFKGWLMMGRLRLLARERGDMSGYPHFQVAFPDWPAEKLSFTYYTLQKNVALEDFPVLPDDLMHELGLEGPDLDKVMKELVEKYGGHFEVALKNQATQPLQTARDVVNWIGQATSPESIK